MNTRSTCRTDAKDDKIADLQKQVAQKTKELESVRTEVGYYRGLILEFEEVEQTNETLEAKVADLELKIAGLKMNVANLSHYVNVSEEKNGEQADEIHELRVDRNTWRAIAQQQRARLARHAHRAQRRAQRLAQRSAQPAQARVDPGSFEQPIAVSDSDSETITDENMYMPPLEAPPLDREPRDRRRVRFDC
jgi:chromosome segregation ATPase